MPRFVATAGPPRVGAVSPLCRLTAALAVALCPGLPKAQTLADDEAVITLPRVEVTGSHIRRVELETGQPLLVLDRARLERTGLDSVGEILQQLPQHVADLNTDYNNGGNGQTRVDLRNLGAQRTLVLLNGHRYVSTIDGAIDVSSIPLPIVERIEVLTDGASAIYGSDAIAGVVNVITRDSYDGLEASAQYTANEQGDGQRGIAELTWGREGQHGGFVLNVSYAKQQPIWAGDRAISAVPTFGLPPDDTFARASAITPDGRYGFGPGGDMLPDGTEDTQLTWDARSAGHRPFDWRSDGYNFAPENYLRTPYERAAIYGQGMYRLESGTQLHAMVLLHRRKSSQQLAPLPLFQFGAGGDPNQYVIDTDNVYNPFGQPVTFFSFRPLGRARRFEQDVRTHYVTLGLDGTWTVGARRFDWEANIIEARTRDHQAIGGGVDLLRLGPGVGPSFLDSTGTPTCGTAAAPVADCVPLDFLHGRDGFTQAMYDHIAIDGTVREERRLRDLTAGLSGEVFDLPAGAVGVAAGVEFRKEGGTVDPGELQAQDAFDFGGTERDAVDGDVRTREAYLELSVPLLSERAWAGQLDLSLATRYSHYSSFGGTTNSKIGVAWRPHRDWLVRATWAEGYRAPSTSELFGESGSFRDTPLAAQFYDPCVGVSAPDVAARCAADGVPVGELDPMLGPEVRFGSNPDLQPESARNRGLGVVWSPSAVAGLDVSADWWHIRLEDTIDSLPDYIVPTLCYVLAIKAACDQLRRDPQTGELTDLDVRLLNYGTYVVEGYDVSLRYAWSNDWGQFDLNWNSVYFSDYSKEIPRGAPPLPGVGNYFPQNPGWRIRSVLSLDWSRRSLGATAWVRYFPSLDEGCFVPKEADHPQLCDSLDSALFLGEGEHVIDSRTYLDLQLRWQPRDGLQWELGVINLFDRDPPVSYNSNNSYDPSYDVPGRFWYVGWRQRF